MVWWVMISSILSAESKPGEVYTLTGQEKSIDKIVEADMENYPELYKGETYRVYVLRFKRENKIGKRKLAIGDELVFPETKSSIKAKAAARRRLLIGKWQSKENHKPRVSRIERVEVVTVIEFTDDGEYFREEEWISELAEEAGQTKHTKTKQGTWILEGDLIKIIYRNEKSKTKIEYPIILLTEEELQTQGHQAKYTRME